MPIAIVPLDLVIENPGKSLLQIIRSAAKKGRPGHPVTPETRAKISAAHKRAVCA
jgi:hypothetical protein